MNPHSTDKTKQKVPSKMNRQRDALRLLSATANAPTPHSNGENARSHGFPGSPTCSNEDTSRGIGLVPFGPAVLGHGPLIVSHTWENESGIFWLILPMLCLDWLSLRPTSSCWCLNSFSGRAGEVLVIFLRGENCVRWICSVKTPNWKEVVKAAACWIDWISITIALRVYLISICSLELITQKLWTYLTHISLQKQ